MAKLTWNETTTESLNTKAQALGVTVISQDQVAALAVEMATEAGKEVTARSIGSKLRKMGFEVQKASETAKSAWSDEDTTELVEFLNANPGEHTYTEVAAAVCAGKFSAKQVQGKILSEELTSLVKPTEKVSAPRTYTADEEVKFIEMVNAGSFVEDIAAAFGREVKQIRGKALSLLRENRIEAIPVQREKVAKERADVLEGLDIASLTVKEIAEKAGTTERGVRSMLSRRGLKAADYDGAAKRAKLDAKASAE